MFTYIADMLYMYCVAARHVTHVFLTLDFGLHQRKGLQCSRQKNHVFGQPLMKTAKMFTLTIDMRYLWQAARKLSNVYSALDGHACAATDGPLST